MSYTQKQSKTILKHGSIGVDGEILCSCSPPLPAVLLTVKKDGPNLGRQFFKCSKPRDSEKCKLYQWWDELPPNFSKPTPSKFPPQGGNRLGTPTPSTPSKPKSSTIKPIPPTLNSSKKVHKQSSDEFDQMLAEDLDDSMGQQPESDDSDAIWKLPPSQSNNNSPTKPRHKATRAVESDIEDYDDEEEEEVPSASRPPTSFPSASASPSPSKKFKFSTTPSTSTTTTPVRASPATGFSAIQNDPNNLFHARQSNLFGHPHTPGTGAEGLSPAHILHFITSNVETLKPILEKNERKRKAAEQRGERLTKLYEEKSEELRIEKLKTSRLEAEIAEFKARK